MSVLATAKRWRRKAAKAADSPWVEGLGRFGLAAKGASFLIVGVLAILVALGPKAKPEDRQGALRLIAEQPLGALLLIALGLGFGGYAAWRLAQAVFNRDGENKNAKGWAKRGGNLAKSGLYAGLAVLAFSFVTGPRGESASEPERTQQVLQWPGGQELVGLVGFAVMGAGIWNGWRAFALRYRKDMKTQEMNEPTEWWMDVVGIVGHAARMFVFCMIGFFVLRAAYQFDPDEAIGLDGALRKLANAPHGGYWLLSVAAGLIAYALFCFLQARYRDV